MALDLSAVATSLMDSLGKRGTVSLVQQSKTFDPILATETIFETVTELSGVNVAVPTEMVDDELVRLTDRLFIIDNTVAPSNTDLMRVDGKDYSIISIDTVKHADVVQVYKVVARG